MIRSCKTSVLGLSTRPSSLFALTVNVATVLDNSPPSASQLVSTRVVHASVDQQGDKPANARLGGSVNPEHLDHERDHSIDRVLERINSSPVLSVDANKVRVRLKLHFEDKIGLVAIPRNSTWPALLIEMCRYYKNTIDSTQKKF